MKHALKALILGGILIHVPLYGDTNMWDVIDYALKLKGGKKDSAPAAAPAPAAPGAPPSAPGVAAPQPSTVSAKRYVGHLGVYYQLNNPQFRPIPWVKVKSGSFKGRCLIPDLLNIDDTTITVSSLYQAPYFQDETGTVQFYPDTLVNMMQPQKWSDRNPGQSLSQDFLQHLAQKGCYSEGGQVVVYAATTMIDKDVIIPRLRDTEIQAQIVSLPTIPGYVFGVITKVGTHPRADELMGACVDFDSVIRSDGSKIPGTSLQQFLSYTIKGFVTLDNNGQWVDRSQQQGDPNAAAQGMQVANAIRQQGSCRMITPSGMPLQISMLSGGKIITAAELIELVQPPVVMTPQGVTQQAVTQQAVTPQQSPSFGAVDVQSQAPSGSFDAQQSPSFGSVDPSQSPSGSFDTQTSYPDPNAGDRLNTNYTYNDQSAVPASA